MSAVDVKLAGGSLGGGPATWELWLQGDIPGNATRGTLFLPSSGAPEDVNRAVFHASRIVVKETAGGVTNERIILELAKAAEIPAGLIDAGSDEFRDQASINADIELAIAAGKEALVRQLLFLMEEVQRRLRVVEINTAGAVFLGVQSPFGSAAAFAGGAVKFDLWAVSDFGSDPQVVLTGRFEAVGYAQLSVGVFTRAIGFACAFAFAGEASLRVDVDDFNISLPEFELPSLDLPTLSVPLKLKGSLGLAGAFRRLLNAVDAANLKAEFKEDPDPGPGNEAKLALRVRPGAANAIDWAVVLHDFTSADWNNLTPKLAKFKATITQTVGVATTVATIDAIALAVTAAQTVIEGTVTVGTALTVKDASAQLGPLDFSWEGLVVAPAASTADQPLWVDVRFSRLTISVRDDPDATLAFAGQICLTPSGVHIVELNLVEPYPIVLVAKSAAALARGAAPILRLAFDLAKATADQAQELLKILGKIAAVIGRAAVFVGKVAGQAIEAAGELIGKALAGLAELVAQALKALSRLGTTAPRFAVELRIATDPFELRQVLVTLPQIGATPDDKLSVLGINLAVQEGWQPGLLVDLVTQPGAYLVLSRDTDPASNLEVATVSTDLWLKQEGDKTAPVRDADANEGGRGRDKTDSSDKPLLSVHLNLVQPAKAATFMVVVAGVTRGRAVFLHRLTGAVTDVSLPAAIPNLKFKSAPDAFVLTPIVEDFDVKVDFERERILPLLGMGEPGNEAPAGVAPRFLDKLKGSLANVIWVKRTETIANINNRSVAVALVVGLKAAGLETEITLKADLSLDDFQLKLKASDSFPIKSRRIEERALGLVWVVEQADTGERLADAQIDMFRLGFGGGQSGFELNTAAPGEALKGKARMELRFDGLSSDGKGVVFEVETLKISAGGLDLKAKVRDDAVRLNGVDVPFRFTTGSLEIKGGRLVAATIAGRGTLPPKLIGDADCTIALTFSEKAGEGIVLESGKVELDKKGDPIVCHASRFTLTITNLDIAFVKDNGYHFYYLVTGSLRFTPKPGEFESGLLQFLDGVEMNLERTPLSADPRVLLKHISFQKALNPKKTFNLFNLFTFEIRGFGYHPASPKFGGDPAVNISGQIKFVEIGDVMQPKIDFHGLWIAPPAPNQSLPRIKADGLGIDLNLKGSIRVRGAVLAVDPETKTVEGTELAPPGYDTYGFLGEGELEIPGWGNLAASLGFLELERKERPGERRKSFFFYAEKRQIAVEIPAIIWTFYLREVGFGFGFRYTLEALAAADRATSIPKLIKALDDISKRQGDLHKFSAWRPEAEGDHVTLALKGAIQAYPAQRNWNDAAEEAAENPFLFDLVAAIRCDFTLFMGLRGWIGTNYIDYLNDKEGLRSNPGLRGYLYISAPHRRLLARAIGDSKGYIGERIPALKKSGSSEPPLRRALRAVDWSATLFIKPGLFHYELGWPNQLVVRLMDEPNMRVTVRGGMVFRAADDGLLWGYNIEADAFFRFGGSLQVGPIGVAGEASLDARLVARVICYLSWRFKGSLVYGLVSLDAALAISIRAWLEVDLGIKKFTIRIGFSRSLQLSAAVEIVISTEGVGARVDARVAISAFGCTLSVSIGFTIGDSQLEAARARVQRFLAMSITAEEPDTVPAVAAATGDKRIDSDAKDAEAPAMAPAPGDVVKPNPNSALKPSQDRAKYGDPIRNTDFWLVLYAAAVDPEGNPAKDNFAYALLVPKAPDANSAGFYAAPTQFANAPNEAKRNEDADVYRFIIPTDWNVSTLKRWDIRGGQDHKGAFDEFASAQSALVKVAWEKPIQTESEQPPGNERFTLAHLFDECFLTNTKWDTDAAGIPYRRTLAWREPKPRRYGQATAPKGSTEQERVAARDLEQRNRAATAEENPVVEAVHQARSTVLSMFLEQFVTLATTGPKREVFADVKDLGLVFYGPASDLERLAELGIEKLERDQEGQLPVGKIGIFNKRELWFDLQDPILAASRSTIAANGIKLDWRLQLPFLLGDTVQAANDDPEQFLHHYEITRTMQGREFTPRVVRVKPAATIGGTDSGTVTLLRPDWQFVDDLSDLQPELRRALLPTRDESLALQSAIDWATLVGDDDAVSVTYSVTPVDIAGTRGLPKSFLVEINRPSPPIRPAEAELRFVVTSMGQGEAAHVSATPPKDSLAAVIAVRDPFRGRDNERVIGNIRIDRKYRLVADPEGIRPSGHYGSDGLTERRLGPPSGFGPTADEIVWLLNFHANESELDPNKLKRLFEDMREGDKVPADSDIDALEPDHDTIAKFPLWRRLDGSTGLARVDGRLGEFPPIRFDPESSTQDGVGPKGKLLESLWRRESGEKQRIATRFALETVQTVTDIAKKKVLATFKSKRTPVAIEVRVEPLDSTGHDVGLLRPEAFEWPVHLDMPPHTLGQVQASSGFARFRVPRVDGDHALGLEKLFATGNQLSLLRDSERRVLTQVSFDAAAAFDSKSVTKIDEIHRTSIAGYDLHELDLDDLTRLDTSAVPFAQNATTWRRARRVARIERVSPEMARLMPDANNDWQGWQAHYPSESWRLINRDRGRRGQSKPIRAPWYSAAESTLHFPERVPRIRLLPTAPEGSIAELMESGRPQTLVARLDAPADSPAFNTLRAFNPDVAAVAAALNACTWTWCDLAPDLRSGRLEFSVGSGSCSVAAGQPGEQLTPRLIREALLRFGWKPSDDIIKAFKASHAALEGLTLVVSGSASVADKAIATGTSIIPLTFAAVHHPLIEEVIGELEYAVSGETLYRRNVVTPQPVQPADAKDLIAFMALTAPEKDPYGWAALQHLGLAASLKLYNREADRFATTQELLERINTVMSATAERYCTAFPATRDVIGQPFVEVLLKPGSDRLPGPFDAVLAGSSVEDETGRLDFDHGLAMAQISLRPLPEPGWTYSVADMAWEKAIWPAPEIANRLDAATEKRTTIRIAGYDLELTNQPMEPVFEAQRVIDGVSVEVRRSNKPAAPPPPATPVVPATPATLEALSWPKGELKSEDLDATLTLFFRHAADHHVDLDKSLMLKARVVTAEIVEKPGDNDVVTTKEARLTLAELKALVETEATARINEEFKSLPNQKTQELQKLQDDLNQFPKQGLRDGSGASPKAAPILSPAANAVRQPRLTGLSPFERFGAIKPDNWSAMAAKPTDDDKKQLGEDAAEATDRTKTAFLSLLQNLRTAQPNFAWPNQNPSIAPEYSDFKLVMSEYLAWSQRFLDHASTPQSPLLPFALAAPIKAQPWHLAADSAGRITLSFLHADRWAHARAYAVRPTPRYQNLALGAGYFEDQQDSERLVTAGLLADKEGTRLKDAIGYAVAVSPRTERIEPPVILGSQLVDISGSQIWELVVARHGEELLASSNRSLFARLGSEGTALSFTREYREPRWPDRLVKKQSLPPPILYPERAPELPARPDADSGITGETIERLAKAYPALWKGADIWHISQLPPHYRVTALAVARAGLVVSNVVAAVQDALPRRALKSQDAGDLLSVPQLVIRDDVTPRAISIRNLRMVAHADVAEEGAWPWIATDPDQAKARRDIAWWPDPDVTYTLLRHGAIGPDDPFEEEDAVVRLVARPDPSAEQDDNDSEPIVLRCRGTRLVPLTSATAVTVTPEDIDKTVGTVKKFGRRFLLDFSLQPNPDGAAATTQSARLAAAEDAQRTAFNSVAKSFALIRSERKLTLEIDFTELADIAAVKIHFDDAIEVVSDVASAIVLPEPDKASLTIALNAIAKNLDTEKGALPTGPLTPTEFGELLQRLSAPRYRIVAVLADADNILPQIPSTLKLQASRTGFDVLTLSDLPTDQEAKDVIALTPLHPLAAKGAALWRLCAERLLGGAKGFQIRALDQRNAIVKNPLVPPPPAVPPAPPAPVWDAVGVQTVNVLPPEWLSLSSRGSS